jgi:adenylate cyclase
MRLAILDNLSKKLASTFTDRLSLVGLMLVVVAIVASCVVYLNEPLTLQVLRNALFDQYQRWQPREYQPQPVHIIDVDDESLARLGQWPWPRTRIAELITKLQAADVAAIGFDVIFAEPDRTSPQAMLKLWELSPDKAGSIGKLPDHDVVMAEALGKGRAIVGFSVERTGPGGPVPSRPYGVAAAGESPLPFLHEFSSAVTSMPAFEARAAGNGALTFVPDADGVVRRVPMLLNLQGQVFPSLVAEALRVAQGVGNYVVRTSRIEKTGIEQLGIGKLNIPTTPSGELWLHYSNPVSQRYIPAWKIMSGMVPLASLKDNIVLVGTSAQGLMDLRMNARGEIMPGVEAHAQALEQVLGGTYLARPAWAGSIEALVIVAGGLLLGVLTLTLGAASSAGLAAVMMVGTGWGAWYAFSRHGLLLDPLTPGLCLLAIFILASVIHHLASEHKQRWIKQAFARYVSPNLVSYLVEHPDDLELGGHRRQCSFIFTDLAGFTSLMEKIAPAEAVAMLNAYLDEMIAIAFRHEGTLDRIVGDAVAIMFSAPVTQNDHRKKAFDCALEMHAFATKYAADLNAKGIPFGQTRIGVHSGEVIVGNFGGSTIFDYRALGDTVNTAARLESVNKHLGTIVCVSEATLTGCTNAAVRPVGRLVLKGKTESLMVFEPLQTAIVPVTPEAEYRQAYGLLKSEDPQASAAFEQLSVAYPEDPLVALHLKRLMSGERGELIVLTEK